MLIKDLEDGEIFEYGNNSHDSLTISDDGRTLSYYNLQNGDGSKYGNYRFVMEDGEVPSESNTADAMYGCCYAHIGYADKDYKKGRADAIEEYHDKLSKEMHDLWRFYKADTNNRPKPNFMCAYSMVDLIAEQLKSQDSME